MGGSPNSETGDGRVLYVHPLVEKVPYVHPLVGRHGPLYTPYGREAWPTVHTPYGREAWPTVTSRREAWPTVTSRREAGPIKDGRREAGPIKDGGREATYPPWYMPPLPTMVYMPPSQPYLRVLFPGC